jgi:hypothetical protein
MPLNAYINRYIKNIIPIYLIVKGLVFAAILIQAAFLLAMMGLPIN